jgi:hypothetical protein
MVAPVGGGQNIADFLGHCLLQKYIQLRFKQRYLLF